ncbi:MAG: dTMP kinase [Promethearchaeota archaeon]
MNKGLFIVIDGIDGCGSTTHTESLGNFLKTKGIKVHITREPSQFETGKLIRNYLKRENIPPPIDALLFAADRVEHYYREILPKLIDGFIVIGDRYIESSIAYQTAQSGSSYFGENFQKIFNTTLEWVSEINKFAPMPDITIILDIKPEISLKRKYTKSESKNESDNMDKFETISFLKKVRKIYLRRAKSMCNLIIDVDQPKSVVSKIINDIVLNKMKQN